METEPTPLNAIRKELDELASDEYAAVSKRFFKTGPGQYGEGDRFIGIRVPALRKLGIQYRDVPAEAVQTLLTSPIHEERLLALVIMMHRYAQGKATTRKRMYELYLGHTRFINNWDLVDISAPHIIGRHLLNRDKAPLLRLARSRDLWERRVAIVSTFSFIREHRYEETLRISEILLNDEEDLIHKAVGWMLREVGKRDFASEETFLNQHYRTMPRTMLRYAIERFPEELRQGYLKGEVESQG